MSRPGAAGARLLSQPVSVLAETFDGEAVVVHLETGIYYSFDRAATELWSLLKGDRLLGEVAEHLLEDSERRPEARLAEVASFAAFLQAEKLAEFVGPLPPSPDQWPGVGRFTDMSDLITLDPIHDIDLDGDGWPAVPQPESV
jgi:hypothetical protein